jgi:hypothetical protein
MSHNIEDLRNRLFAALDGLADDKHPMEIDRARAIADVARVIVDSAKAEVSLLHATGAKRTSTEFIPLALAVPAGGQRQLTAGGCPSCGGRLKPETNGNGGLVDRCMSCGRSPAPAGSGPRRAAAGEEK